MMEAEARAVTSDREILARIEGLSLAAGRAIMEVFDGACEVEIKADASPVTEADRRAEAIILAGLRDTWPDIPCVAEEEVCSGILPTELGETFFLVDPLDGTREFIRRSPDFTVNIALICAGRPAIGIVYAPAARMLYAGAPGTATAATVSEAFEVVERRPIAVPSAGATTRIVASRSHLDEATREFVGRFSGAEITYAGSSLKFCAIASGEAELYPRFGRTMEWDTAAGDAVLRAAGGMTVASDGAPLVYGKRGAADRDFENPSFIAAASDGFLKQALALAR